MASLYRRLRIPALVLLCCGMAACARLPWQAPKPEPEQPRETAPSTTRPVETGAAEAPRDSGRDAVQFVATGPEAVAQRRGELVSGERALDPEGLGYFMDVHEARLLQSLGDAIRMRREGKTFHLLVTGQASFNTGSERLRDFLRRELRALAGVLTEFDGTMVIANAHTDSRGDPDFNRELSARRAMRVAETLVEYGVNPARLVAVGHGEADPVADNDTAEGRARNRRLEIVIEAVVRSEQD